MLFLLKDRVSPQIIGILLHWRFVWCLTFIHSFDRLYQHGLMDIYTFGDSPTLLYFVVQIVPALVTGRSLSGSCVPLT